MLTEHSIVVVPGFYAGASNQSWIWLVRDLANDMPEARILFYGYESPNQSQSPLAIREMFHKAPDLTSQLQLKRQQTQVSCQTMAAGHLWAKWQ